MVKVLILGATLQQRMSETELDLEIDGPIAIKTLIEGNADLLDALAPFVVRGELLVTVNRKVGSLDSVVKDGDVLKIAHQTRAYYDGTTDIPT
jgi:molybdopterin synthase sulfur carrier subunit